MLFCFYPFLVGRCGVVPEWSTTVCFQTVSTSPNETIGNAIFRCRPARSIGFWGEDGTGCEARPSCSESCMHCAHPGPIKAWGWKSGNTNEATQHHIQEAVNSEQNRCSNLKYRNIPRFGLFATQWQERALVSLCLCKNMEPWGLTLPYFTKITGTLKICVEVE